MKLQYVQVFYELIKTREVKESKNPQMCVIPKKTAHKNTKQPNQRNQQNIN
jgi:hypothetical protein